MLVSNLGRLCELVHLSNSHASLALQVSNNPIKIRVWTQANFTSFIQQPDYWNDPWNQICDNEIINPLVRQVKR